MFNDLTLIFLFDIVIWQLFLVRDNFGRMKSEWCIYAVSLEVLGRCTCNKILDDTGAVKVFYRPIGKMT